MATTFKTYSTDKIDSLLSAKQGILNSTQLSAVNSGVTSSTVTQVATNTTNITNANTNIANVTSRVGTIESTLSGLTESDLDVSLDANTGVITITKGK